MHTWTIVDDNTRYMKDGGNTYLAIKCSGSWSIISNVPLIPVPNPMTDEQIDNWRPRVPITEQIAKAREIMLMKGERPRTLILDMTGETHMRMEVMDCMALATATFMGMDIYIEPRSHNIFHIVETPVKTLRQMRDDIGRAENMTKAYNAIVGA